MADAEDDHSALQSIGTPAVSPPDAPSGPVQGGENENRRGADPPPASPVSDDALDSPDSPDLIPPDQVPLALANAVAVFVRPEQFHTPPVERGLDDEEDDEELAWNTVLTAEGQNDVREAVREYLLDSSMNSFLARIAAVHGQDEMITRRRFALRYLDDLPEPSADGSDGSQNQALMLQRMLTDEVDLLYRLPGESLRRWQELLRHLRGSGASRAMGPILNRQLMQSIREFLFLYGFDEWLHCFRQTHGHQPNYRAAIEDFFHRGDVTGREETLTPPTMDLELLSRGIVAWTNNPDNPLIRAAAGRSRLSVRYREVANERLSHVEDGDFDEEDNELSEHQSLGLIQAAFDLDHSKFRWGRLYVLILRHVELFGPQHALETVATHTGAHSDTSLASSRGCRAAPWLHAHRRGESGGANIGLDDRETSTSFAEIALRAADQPKAVRSTLPACRRYGLTTLTGSSTKSKCSCNGAPPSAARAKRKAACSP